MNAAKWADWPALAFDTETTGIDVTTDRIVTAALVQVELGKRPATTLNVVDPGIDIPEGATAVHGYTRDRAIAEATHRGPDGAAQMLFEITGRIALWLGHGYPLVGFNLAYDLSLLEHECARHGIEGLQARLGRGKVSPIVDCYVLDKKADPYRKGGRKLTDVCAHYGVIHTGAHDADGDALAAARLWPKIMATHARVFPGMTLMGLHQSQVKWRREQMDSLRAYFDRKGIEHDGCDGGWPLLSSAEALPLAPVQQAEGVRA